jgi:uncharacterized protein YwgA
MGELKKVIACMKEVGRKPRVGNFEDKLIIQKTVCLLELMGFDMGYRFSLYVRGPYSPDLTTDLYAHQDWVENLKTDYVIATKEKEILVKISEASDNLDPALLEIMATYAFISKIPGVESKEAVLRLKKLKPFYSEAKIAVGISRTKQLFPPTEKEVKEMKAEFEEMESAAVSDNRY